MSDNNGNRDDYDRYATLFSSAAVEAATPVKRCISCGEHKPDTEEFFSRRNAKSDPVAKLRNQCRNCLNSQERVRDSKLNETSLVSAEQRERVLSLFSPTVYVDEKLRDELARVMHSIWVATATEIVTGLSIQDPRAQRAFYDQMIKRMEKTLGKLDDEAKQARYGSADALIELLVALGAIEYPK